MYKRQAYVHFVHGMHMLVLPAYACSLRVFSIIRKYPKKSYMYESSAKKKKIYSAYRIWYYSTYMITFVSPTPSKQHLLISIRRLTSAWYPCSVDPTKSIALCNDVLVNCIYVCFLKVDCVLLAFVLLVNFQADKL